MFTTNKYSRMTSLLTGILAVVAAFIMMANPAGSLRSIVLVFAWLLIIEGIMKYIDYFQFVKASRVQNTSWWLSALIDILFGLLLLVFPGIGATFVWISIALSVIIDSGFELWLTSYLKADSKGYYWFSVILAVLGIVLGVVLLFKPAFALALAMTILAIYLLMLGILLIMRSF